MIHGERLNGELPRFWQNIDEYEKEECEKHSQLDRFKGSGFNPGKPGKPGLGVEASEETKLVTTQREGSS